MDVSAAQGITAQEAANKTQAGYDVLTKTLAKTEQNQQSEQQRLQVAEQTGKGLNIDIKA